MAVVSSSIERSLMTSTKSTFSRRSATYTTSTFATFEYGSSYKYHGMFNYQGEDSQGDPNSVQLPILDDLDDLLKALSEKELKELAIVDPDDSSVPPDMRCLYHCEKEPSEKINRSHLLRVLRENAYNAPVQEEMVPFQHGMKRGKPYVPHSTVDEESNSDVNKEVKFQPVSADEAEMSAVLDQADLQSLREIAEILDVQFQYDCKAEELKVYPSEAENEINANDIIERVEANDPELVEVNLNNVKTVSFDQWQRLFKGLENNTHVGTLMAANCNLQDNAGLALMQCLSKNTALKHLTLDSNLFSPRTILAILAAISVSKSLSVLRINNQLNCKRFGHQMEQEIVQIVDDCPQLLKLGITMEFREPLNKLARILQRNLSQQKRIISE